MAFYLRDKGSEKIEVRLLAGAASLPDPPRFRHAR